MSENHAHAKQVVAFNMALVSGKLNVTSMEATLAVAQRKDQVKELERQYILGSVSLGSQKMNPVFSEDAWTESVDKKIEALKARHRDAMQQLEDEGLRQQKELERQIEEVDARIRKAQNETNAATDELEIARRGAPVFDRGAIGDVERIRRNVDASRDIVARLEKKIENFRERKTESIRDILAAPSPRFKFGG